MGTATEMRYHPASMIFPLMDDDAIDALIDDIRANGLRIPILLHQDGRIIDGRNRQTACLLAGVDPSYETCKETDEQKIAELVWSLNMSRRQLKPEQVNAAAVKRDEYLEALTSDAKKRQQVAGKKHGRGQHKKDSLPSVDGNLSPKRNATTAAAVAKSTGTSSASIERTKAVKENAPDLFAQMEKGEIKTNTAYNQMRKRQKAKELEDKAVAAKAMMRDEPMWMLIQQDVIDGLKSVIDHHAPARLIFADPPYNIGVDYGGEVDDSRPEWEYMAWVSDWLGLCVDAMSDDGSLWVMIGDEYAAEYAIELKSLGLTIRSWVKWYETFGVNCSNNFNRTSRHIFYCVRDPKKFYFNSDAVTRPSDRQTKYKDKRAATGGKVWDDVWQIPRLTGTAKERLPDFPTQLPLELLRAIVGCASEPGDLVVDPFNGSGTTGVACIEAGRRYIGIDSSETFIDIAHKRLTVAQHEIQ